MRQKLISLFFLCSVISFSLALQGCTLIFQKGRRVDVERISKLKSEVSDLERAKQELEQARQELEDRLKNEIDDKNVKVEMNDKGLVITFVAEVLFDSGKAILRKEALETLNKIAGVLNTTVADLDIGVEGHTDNDPIKYSGWLSNWELSTGRALSVLHYLADEQQVAPQRFAAIGYGEYRPVVNNDSKVNKQKNRRVEIVILPKISKEGLK